MAPLGLPATGDKAPPAMIVDSIWTMTWVNETPISSAAGARTDRQRGIGHGRHRLVGTAGRGGGDAHRRACIPGGRRGIQEPPRRGALDHVGGAVVDRAIEGDGFVGLQSVFWRATPRKASWNAPWFKRTVPWLAAAEAGRARPLLGSRKRRSPTSIGVPSGRTSRGLACSRRRRNGRSRTWGRFLLFDEAADAIGEGAVAGGI